MTSDVMEMTLGQAPLHTPLILTRGPEDPGLGARLRALGLRPGAQVELVQRTPGDGRIVAVSDSRVALDRAMTLRLGARPAAA